jgi:histidine triad (HIT) family protein
VDPTGGQPSVMPLSVRGSADERLCPWRVHCDRMTSRCVFCERSALRDAEFYLENEYCVYASSRDPSDPPGVLPGSGVLVPKEHRASPFDLTVDEWAAIRPLLLDAKAIQDARLAPDGYLLSWTSFPARNEDVPSMHAHLHVVPRFDDEPMRDHGGRVGIKGPENRRPDPARAGTGRARRFGPA